MSDEHQLAEALGKVLDSEPVKNLLSPMTKEVGELLGTIANVVKFYATDQLKNVFTKWAKNRSENAKTIDASDFQRIMPLLPYAAMQSDDDLQERWAALLESTVSNPDETLPSFGQTLSQINADEAKFLDRLQEEVNREKPQYPPNSPLASRRAGELNYLELSKVYDPKNLADLDSAGLKPLAERADLVINDLIRLGIIQMRSKPTVAREVPAFASGTTDWYSISPYGRSFIRAVTPLSAE